MIERLETIEKRYNELTEELMKPEVISNIKKTSGIKRSIWCISRIQKYNFTNRRCKGNG